MARAYVDGFQTSTGEALITNGWGFHSVNAMVKHLPGGEPEEGGRDGHFAYGKFAVYPGNNFKEHLIPFTEGAFKLSGPTGNAAAVLPYYTISFDQDTVNGENVGNTFNKYLITDLLRGEYGYEGVVCTDWGVTGIEGERPEIFAGKSWGVETLSIAERHYKVLIAGADQFGGNNDIVPVLEAYEMGVKELGEEAMRARFEKSAVRLLRNIFQVGLFENPYLDPEASQTTVGKPEFMDAGYQAQLKSVVLLKNEAGVLPIKEKKKAYIPQKYIPSTTNWWGIKSEAKWVDAVNLTIAANYIELVTDPAQADLALVFVDSPESGTGYDPTDREAGGTGHVPISLQYGPYKAVSARDSSIASGDPVVAPEVLNRSYKNKTVTTANAADLKSILDTKTKIGNKQVIVFAKAANPMVMAEFESKVQGIFLHFGVQDQVVFDLITGKSEPSALLPVQMPASMETVETQLEDVAHDMMPYVDATGNSYDFAFGLNWSGVITDERVPKYKQVK